MTSQPLRRADLDPDPIVQFGRWWREAAEAGQPEPEAIALATASASGSPSVRFVLLREFDERGFVFYTNRTSRKGEDLAANPRAAFAIRWLTQDRQIRVEGRAETVDDATSDAYFASRARASQLGAWASDQTAPLASRQHLEEALAATEARFAGSAVVRPPHWGGYRIVPDMVEFWQQGAARLHDRFRYERSGEDWTLTRLNP